MTRRTRPISWIKSSRKGFDGFKKKSTQGIKTPKREIQVAMDRLKRLKEMLG